MMMEYPDLDHVVTANRLKLAMWCRFLPSPGSAWIARTPAVFDTQMAKEATILEAIRARFNELGGWSPSLSKKVSWDEPEDKYNTFVVLDNQRKDA
jgi:hypothetical protein